MTLIKILFRMRCVHITASDRRCKNDAVPGKSGCHKHQDVPTLYEQLGGIEAITLVVNDFSDNLLKNPMVGVESKNPHLREWSRKMASTRMPFLKFMRSDWLASISGGPYEFCSTKPGENQYDLSKVHEHLHISSEEFDEVARELGKSLTKYKVPKPLQKQVLSVFAAHKPEVVYP